MPTVKRFGSVKIKIYGGDHNPPHVHIIGTDFAALVAIADGEILSGTLAARNRTTILRWIANNRGALIEIWNRLTSQE